MKNPSSLVQKAYQHALPIIEKYCKHYPFHNEKHTKSVFDRASYIAINEDLNQEDIEDLQISALFHDIGFIEQYPKNEYIGSQIAKKWLIEQGHPIHRIEKIEDIIMATVLFSPTNTILEEIIQDADVDNIGTNQSFEFSRNLQTELAEIAHLEISECTYWQFSHKVHNMYQFHRKISKLERNKQKILNVKHLEAYLEMLGCEVIRGKVNLDHII